MGRVKGGLLGVLGVGGRCAADPDSFAERYRAAEQLADPDSRFAVANGIKLR